MATHPVLLGLEPDGRLAERVRDGSDRAFEVLFERHHRALLAFCRSMVGSSDEADDAVQQTFLAAYRDLVRGRRPEAVRPWLYGIARRRCIALLTARRARPEAGQVEAATEPLAAHVDAREDLRAVLGDVEALPEAQRTALVLAELEGFAHEEIATVLGCRREKVKALVFQARTTLTLARAARDTPCAEVRAGLDSVRGAVARRKVLRRHLRDCAACQAYRDGRRGRRALGLVLPGVGLERLLLGSVLGGAAGSAGVAATALVAVAIPVGGVAAVALPASEERPPARTAAAQPVVRAAPIALAAAPAPAPLAATRTAAAAATPAKAKAKAKGKAEAKGRARGHAKRKVRQTRPGTAPPTSRRAAAAQPVRGSRGRKVKAKPKAPRAAAPGRARPAGTVPASPRSSPPTRSNPSAERCACSRSSRNGAR